MSHDMDIAWLSQHAPKVTVDPRLMQRTERFCPDEWRIRSTADDLLKIGFTVALCAMNTFPRLISSYEIIKVTFKLVGPTIVACTCKIVLKDPSLNTEQEAVMDVTLAFKAIGGTKHDPEYAVDATKLEDIPMAVHKRTREAMAEIMIRLRDVLRKRKTILDAFQNELESPSTFPGTPFDLLNLEDSLQKTSPEA